jgi:hypothetical protein
MKERNPNVKTTWIGGAPDLLSSDIVKRVEEIEKERKALEIRRAQNRAAAAKLRERRALGLTRKWEKKQK